MVGVWANKIAKLCFSDYCKDLWIENIWQQFLEFIFGVKYISTIVWNNMI